MCVCDETCVDYIIAYPPIPSYFWIHPAISCNHLHFHLLRPCRHIACSSTNSSCQSPFPRPRAKIGRFSALTSCEKLIGGSPEVWICLGDLAGQSSSG